MQRVFEIAGGIVLGWFAIALITVVLFVGCTVWVLNQVDVDSTRYVEPTPGAPAPIR